MIESLQTLITSLREELQQYGEMLALLNRQQEYIVARASDEVFQTVSLIQAQGQVIQQARSHREECRRVAARHVSLPANSSFASLIALLPPEYQPLVRALVEENNELLVRVQQRARQNHLLLSRSLEFMQGFINSLLPGRETSVYNDHGNMEPRIIPLQGRYEAVG
jgi:flagellar biosynthesis/type III secretory pathway chaperone